MRSGFDIFGPKELFALLLGSLVCSQASAQFDYYPLGNGQAAITGYWGSNTTVIVPGTINGFWVTVIGGSAFAERGDIVSVTIPEGVTTIGKLGPTIANGTFNDCYSLTNVTLPRSLRIIGSLTFGSCVNLKSLRIPDGVTGIGNGAFDNCGLTSITLPNSVTTLQQAFRSCFSLTNITLSTNLTSLVYAAVFECPALRSIRIPASINSLEQGTFLYCENLAGIYFEGNAPMASANPFVGLATNAVVYYVPCMSGWNDFTFLPKLPWWEGALSYTTDAGSIAVTGFIPPCDYLPTVNIPATINGALVTQIGSNAFSQHSSLSSALISASVTNLAPGAFQNCSNLASIGFLGSPPALGSGALVNDTQATVFYLPCATGWTSFFAGLPTALGWQFLFEYATNSGAITITSYSGLCDTVSVPSTLEGLPVVGIGSNAFYGRTNLLSVTLPNSVTAISAGAFQYCSNLATVLFPNNLGSIGDHAFESCSSLSALSLPASVGSIGANAFAGCVSLQNLTFPAGASNIGPAAFQQCSSLSSVVLPNRLSSISDYTFEFCTSLSAVSIPAGVAGIGTNAFAGCLNLQNLLLPAGLRNIGRGAFYYCSSLAGLALPDALTSVGDHAFESCVSLTSLTLPANVTNIGVAAFADCTGLSALGVNALNPNYRSAGGVLFNKTQTTLMQCPGGATGVYNVPGSVTNINGWAFYGCRQLANVTIPPGVRSIGTWAFDSCVSLTNLSLPSSVVDIGDVAFRNCTSLNAITVDPANPAYSSLAGVLFSKDLTVLIQYPPAKAGSYRAPDQVTTIWDWAFADASGLAKVILGTNLTYIGDNAFWGCPNLRALVFEGNAPLGGSDLFGADGPLVIYYSPNSTGWTSTYGGQPTMLWKVSLQNAGSTPGGGSEGFSFNIVGTSNLVVVVEACTNLAAPTWFPLSTNALLTGSASFRDPDSRNSASRFYRVRDSGF